MAAFHSDEGMLVIQLYNVQRHDKEMIKEKPRWEILIIKTRQSLMKDLSLKNNDLIRILYRPDNSSTPILHIMPSKGFFGPNYILLHIVHNCYFNEILHLQ